MNVKDLTKRIEKLIPLSSACEWDNVGLLAGRGEKEVRKILLAVDATNEVVDMAVKENVDLLITHHPMVFSPVKKVTDEDFLGKKLITLLQKDISYYAMHTNYDVERMGKLAGKMLGLKKIVPVDVIQDLPVCKGIGAMGILEKEVTLEEVADMVKETFSLDKVRIYGDLKKTMRKVAILPGSGKHDLDKGINAGIDVFITGDVDHHGGLDCLDQGMAVIDAGHYGVEHIFIEDMRKFLIALFENRIEVVTVPIHHPFVTR